MIYVFTTLFGFVIGIALAFVWLKERKKSIKSAQLVAETVSNQARVVLARQDASTHAISEERARLESLKAKLQLEMDTWQKRNADLNSGFFTKNALAQENERLKGDLLSSDVLLRKLKIDRQLQEVAQVRLDARSKELAEEYLASVEKSVAEKINANNYASCRQRLVKAMEWCREIGFDVTVERETALLTQLKADFELEVRRQVEKEEQSRIRAQIREEEKLVRELEKARLAAEREQAAVQQALNTALAAAQGQTNAEIESLKVRLAEAEAKVQQRTLSQAQLTKAGHIYVISNFGAFGDKVYKIGMTRRLEPKERIWELGDASVPFTFDIHMMVSCDDAPTLENAIHRHFHKHRVNKVNPRKEFFRIELEEIRKFVVANRGEVEFIAEYTASEYHQSMSMSEDDQAVIDQAFAKADSVIGVVRGEE